jgi:ribonuclease HI
VFVVLHISSSLAQLEVGGLGKALQALKRIMGRLISIKNATKTGDSAYVRQLIKEMNRLLREQQDLIDS